MSTSAGAKARMRALQGGARGAEATDQHIVILSERSAPKDSRGDSGMRCGWCLTGSFDCGGSRRLRSG